MACISSGSKPAPDSGNPAKRKFSGRYLPDGDAAALASANAKVRPCQNCGTLRPYPPRRYRLKRRTALPRKPVTRGGMPAPVGGGSRRPALSDKDGVLLRVIGVGWIVRRRPSGLIP